MVGTSFTSVSYHKTQTETTMLVLDFTNTIKEIASQCGFESTVQVKSKQDTGTVIQVNIVSPQDLFAAKTATFITTCADYNTVTRMFRNWIDHIKKYGVPTA